MSKPTVMRRVLLGALYFLSVALCVSAVHAQGAVDARFEALLARWLSLRNTDSRVQRPAEWNGLSRDFVEYVRSTPRAAAAPRALMSAAVLHREMGAAQKDDDELLKAIVLLDQICDQYPESVLADDALLQKGEIYGEFFDYREREAGIYRQVIAEYPGSDSATLAGVRLRQHAAVETHDTHEDEAPVAVNGGRVVVIDPGHGGEDYGAVGVGGVYEKDVALQIALELERILAADPGTSVYLTRRRDEFVPLIERTNLVNSVNATLFVSVHANASLTRTASGIETYYLDNTGNQASKKLAERENESLRMEGGTSGNDLSFMLSDLIQNAKLDDSIRLANQVHQALVRRVASTTPGVRDLGVRSAPFWVLVGAHVPCILVEVAFVDHPVEGKRLILKSYRQSIAEGLAAGIRGYLDGVPVQPQKKRRSH